MKGLALILVATAALLGAACSKTPTRQWSADDHDRVGDPGNTVQPEQAPPPPQAASDQAPAPSIDEATQKAWLASCVPCHGSLGRGDGPTGIVLRAPDLSRSSWQDSVSDDSIRTVIQQGRGKMPAFNFPAPVSDGLVRKVRSLRRKP